MVAIPFHSFLHESKQSTVVEITKTNITGSIDILSTHIRKELENILGLSSSLSLFLTTLADKYDSDRDMIVNILYDIINKNKQIKSIWTLWEPNGFDGKDVDFVKDSLYPENGRFFISWVRLDTENIIRTTDLNMAYLNSFNDPHYTDFYNIPKQTKQAYLDDPAYYDYNNSLPKPIFISSLSFPILDKVTNNFLGIVGIDIDLHYMSKLITDTNIILPENISILLAPKGTVAIALSIGGREPSQISELIGLNIDNILPNYKDIQKQIIPKSNFEPQYRNIINSEYMYLVSEKIKLSNNITWELLIIIPTDNIKSYNINLLNNIDQFSLITIIAEIFISCMFLLLFLYILLYKKEWIIK
jgi:hypothetical protein